MENCGELSALTKTAAVLECIGLHLQNAANYRQSSKSKEPNGWLITWDKPVFHTKLVEHTSISVERKRALEQTFASKQASQLLDAACIPEGNIVKLMPDEASSIKDNGKF